MNYVALDIGNVLCDVDFTVFTRHLSKELNLTMDEADHFFNRIQRLHDIGLTNIADELADHFKIKSPVIIEELLRSWNKVIEPNEVVLDKFSRMVARDQLQIALVSNIGLEHASIMKNLLGGYGVLNNTIEHFSCYVGARKPTSLFYQSLLMEHPEFTGCLFVDDRQENLDAAKRFGFQTYRFALDEPPHSSLRSKLLEIEKMILNSKNA